MTLLTALLYLLLVGSAVPLGAIILLQESKGGGLADAFGGLGAETFGVKAAGIHKATAIMAAIFLVSAVLITVTGKL